MNKKTGKVILLIIGLITLIFLSIYYIFFFVSEKDKNTYSQNYIQYINKKLEKKGYAGDKITKEDFILLDSIISNGLINIPTEKDFNETLNKTGVDGLSYKEFLLFHPRISGVRELCKKDPTYCEIIKK